VIGAVVIGAGVVGLAVARELAKRGHAPLIVDRERRFGTGTSSRNSEVIHAGLYYEPSSLKARTCIAGSEELYRYCSLRHVPTRRTGKLIVATAPEENAQLDAIEARAAACGVQVERLDRAQARRLEPELECTGALYSPTTGIVDSHGLMLALLGDLESLGGQFVGAATVTHVEATPGGWSIRVDGVPAVQAPIVVNAAGLDAQKLAGSTDGVPPGSIPRLYMARGRYFSVSGRVPFKRLIYPVPVDGGLGVHLTLDLSGQARLGPDVTWVEQPDYTVDPGAAPAFAQAARRFWPGLEAARLRPDYAGVRPKIRAPGEPAGDFVLSGPAEHGMPGLVNLYGIESPGLTAAIALARIVAEKAVEVPARAAA
jgi:L-2-hydroxyglutarate oxidase LhgO